MGRELVAIQNRRQSKGRHPSLRFGTAYHEVYLAIKQKPEITTVELANLLKKRYNTTREYVRVLKQEGLVVETGTYRVTDNHNKAACLRVVAENETGFARDTLEVELVFYVNDFGEYSVRAALKGQALTATEDNPRPVHRVMHLDKVPRPHESFRTRELFDTQYSPSTAQTKKPIVIDAEVLDTKDE